VGYTFQFRMPASDWLLLLQGAERTCLYSITGLLAGLALGIACALGRQSRHLPLRLVA
jgi:ABC-type amino acid transport system permease subunit